METIGDDTVSQCGGCTNKVERIKWAYHVVHAPEGCNVRTPLHSGDLAGLGFISSNRSDTVDLNEAAEHESVAGSSGCDASSMPSIARSGPRSPLPADDPNNDWCGYSASTTANFVPNCPFVASV
jgi:hypothetical protein